MSPSERRRFRRVDADLDISLKEVGTEAEQIYTGQIVNISPGGAYLHISDDIFKTVDGPQERLFKVELSIPPTKGLLEFGGKVAGFARLLRTCNVPDPTRFGECGVGLEFCQPLKLSV